MPMNVIVDTDPAMGSLGIGAEDPEDGFAIMLALRSPELDVRAITVVHGNVPLDHGYSNAVHLVDLLGRGDVPVAPGLAGPLLRPLGADHASREKAGARRISPMLDVRAAPAHAVDLIIETIMNGDEPVTIIAIGPLSNVAAVLIREPALARSGARLVIMGGALRVPGNVNPSAEFNIWADPEAASIVFNSGIPITLVGLDVCHQTLMRSEQVRSLNGNSLLAHFVREATSPWVDVVISAGKEGFHLYDSLAVAIAIRPELVRMEPVWVDIELKGEHTLGQTVAYLDPSHRAWFGDKPNCEACLDLIDVQGFADLMDERVLVPLRA